MHEWNPPALAASACSTCERSWDFACCSSMTRIIAPPHHRNRFEPSASIASTACWRLAKHCAGSIANALGSTRVWTLHEAADTSIFKPLPEVTKQTTSSGSETGATTSARARSRNFCCEPAASLRDRQLLHSMAYAIRRTGSPRCAKAGVSLWRLSAQPRCARRSTQRRGLPFTFRASSMLRRMAGIPTIRVFEALACGIPLDLRALAGYGRALSRGRFLTVSECRGDAVVPSRFLLNNPAAAEAQAARGLRNGAGAAYLRPSRTSS